MIGKDGGALCAAVFFCFRRPGIPVSGIDTISGIIYNMGVSGAFRADK